MIDGTDFVPRGCSWTAQDEPREYLVDPIGTTSQHVLQRAVTQNQERSQILLRRRYSHCATEEREELRSTRVYAGVATLMR